MKRFVKFRAIACLVILACSPIFIVLGQKKKAIEKGLESLERILGFNFINDLPQEIKQRFSDSSD